MNTLNLELDFIVLSSIDTLGGVYNGALSNLKNLILKFRKNMIININLKSLEIERLFSSTNVFLFID